MFRFVVSCISITLSLFHFSSWQRTDLGRKVHNKRLPLQLIRMITDCNVRQKREKKLKNTFPYLLLFEMVSFLFSSGRCIIIIICVDITRDRTMRKNRFDCGKRMQIETMDFLCTFL